MRGAATEHVFRLLPEEGELEKFGKVGTDERRTRHHTARNVAPVGTVQTIGNSGRTGTDARGEGSRIAAGMTAENKVECAIDGALREELRIGTGQEIVLESETLDIPSCTPDAGRR